MRHKTLASGEKSASDEKKSFVPLRLKLNCSKVHDQQSMNPYWISLGESDFQACGKQ